MAQVLLRRLRLRQSTLAWASSGPTGGNRAHCSRAARHAAQRL